MTICERLFTEMDNRGLIAAELCRILDVKSNTVTNWRQRNTDPPAKYILPICDFLGCSPEYLLTGQETKKEPALGISENGRKMLEIYLLLDKEQQAFLLGEASGMLRENEKKRGLSLSEGKAV